MVRYFGIYAPRKRSVVQHIAKQIGKMVGRAVRRLNWRKRIQRDFGHDPLRCSKCGDEMELFSITVPWRGKMFTIGGWDWWLARGVITPVDDPPRQLTLPLDFSPPQPRQLALPLIFAA